MLATGSLDTWWQLQGEWVEEPNVRRGGQSGVQRINQAERLLYAKRQTGHTYRSLLHPFGRPTVLRERDALLGARRAGVCVPEIVYCATERSHQGWRGLLVTAALEGYQPISDWYLAQGRECHGEPAHQRVMQLIAENLARLHKARWQHGCLYAKHIFVKVSDSGQAEVALLDLEKSRRRLLPDQAARHDLQQLRRHSPWSQADWEALLSHYRASFGRAVKGLPA
jgi:tRNA A-37 threonylcarbamoyl transferase component Bud32